MGNEEWKQEKERGFGAFREQKGTEEGEICCPLQVCLLICFTFMPLISKDWVWSRVHQKFL